MLRNTHTLILLFFTVLGLSACGGGGSETAEVEITPVGEQMQYAVTEFSVKAGQTVHLVFRNTATSPAMSHNVVLLNSRDVIDRVGQAALQAGEANDYIPQDDAILSHTPLASPGETVEVTFTAPSTAGDYPYICTFPGHYVMMQGTMHVTS